MQLEYSMIERNAELEFADLATELAMGLVPWSPLGMGVLSGKYKPSQEGFAGRGHQARIHGHVDVRSKNDEFDRPIHVPAPRT